MKEGKFNLSPLDTKGELLLVSQFTLMADTRKGRRPSFVEAAPPVRAEELVNHFVEQTSATGLKVETGRFQQYMQVEIHNDGPVTILLDSRENSKKCSFRLIGLGGDRGIRTPDLCDANAALSLLSYIPKLHLK